MLLQLRLRGNLSRKVLGRQQNLSVSSTFATLRSRLKQKRHFFRAYAEDCREERRASLLRQIEGFPEEVKF